ncbi:MAG: apolipoprotein N-acyltransferase [Verrucomicrobia bacterium]|nr:apolipoprotein N-acyltransferase [Verrucomicrobiota bacterium]
MPDPPTTQKSKAYGKHRPWILRALQAAVVWPSQFWQPLLISALCGGALALAYPRWNLGWLVWVALAPMIVALWFLMPDSGWRRAAQAALCGWVGGCAFYLINLSWITEVSGIGWLAVCLYLALYFAVWAAVVACIGRPNFASLQKDTAQTSWAARIFASSLDSLRVAFLSAATWTALEWIRGWMFTGFGWNGLGVALHDNLVLIQIADIVGVTGISFFVMLAISTIATTAVRLFFEVRHARIRPHADFFVIVAVYMSLFFYGTRKIDAHAPTAAGEEGSHQRLNCLVIQPNIAQEIKWEELYAPDILNKLYDATEAGSNEKTALVIWPETALPYVLSSRTTEDYLNDVLGLGNFALALGVNDVQGDDEFYNAMAVLKGNYSSVRVYRKMHLVPFGEYIPLRREFPPFEWIAGSDVTGDFNRGTDALPLPLPGSKSSSPIEIIPLICFEDTVGDLARKFVSPNAQLMVIVTNNGWFNDSANSVQHVANAKFRCIELRRPMLRSANTGVTCHIEPTGRIAAQIDPGPSVDFTLPADFLVAEVDVAPQPQPTFYAKNGDLFSKVMAGIAGVWILISLIRQTKR